MKTKVTMFHIIFLYPFLNTTFNIISINKIFV
jgi:hypothetical protein